jgi:hypothetical protein
VTYSLEDAPQGMRIDSGNGDIRWTPDESQGPGTYSVAVAAQADSPGQESRHASATFEVTVQEVNRVPVIESLEDRNLDPRNDETLTLTVRAHDPDVPAARLVYALGTPSPENAQLDAQSGRLDWTPTPDQCGTTHDITVRVSDQGPDAQSAETSFRVTVAAHDPWESAAEHVAPAVCLLTLEAPHAKRVFPFATACAIRHDALLTNGGVAAEIERRRRQGWKVKAVWPSEGQELAVRDVRVHRIFKQTADAPAEQIYFELGILRVAGRHRQIAPLAEPADLAQLDVGHELACVGITHNGETIPRADAFRPELKRGSVFLITGLPIPDSSSSAGAPRLLHFKSPLPPNLYGSPIVNSDGRVVAVYAEQAQLPEDEADEGLQIHYAPLITLARAWLAGQGTDHWITPDEPTD